MYIEITNRPPKKNKTLSDIGETDFIVATWQ